MTSKEAPPVSQPSSEALVRKAQKAEALKVALRENLHKRKAQARAKASKTADK